MESRCGEARTDSAMVASAVIHQALAESLHEDVDEDEGGDV
jgi:hypothetical protein